MFHDFDPYSKLEELFLRSMQHETNQDDLSEKLAHACQLMEAMAEQIKHLTNAVIGLQAQNKILHNRLTKLEHPDD
jgi:hypothetical protein